ncbi:leucine-rich repeats and immunoglobulin-like domains 1 [Camelus ferus]|nr:leucine-rich repeats and immunoglobulin-like domains 1 [Camelus ferus]
MKPCRATLPIPKSLQRCFSDSKAKGGCRYIFSAGVLTGGGLFVASLWLRHEAALRSEAELFQGLELQRCLLSVAPRRSESQENYSSEPVRRHFRLLIHGFSSSLKVERERWTKGCCDLGWFYSHTELLKDMAPCGVGIKGCGFISDCSKMEPLVTNGDLEPLKSLITGEVALTPKPGLLPAADNLLLLRKRNKLTSNPRPTFDCYIRPLSAFGNSQSVYLRVLSSNAYVCGTMKRYLNNNELMAVPSLGAASSHIVSLFLQHNRIRSVEGSQLKAYLSLEVLDLSSNNITEVRGACFPHGLPIKELDLNRNRIRLIEGLTFQGLDSLEVLKLQRNNISRLTDGAFWGLSRMLVLHLESNSLAEVNSGSLYGLSALHQLHLGNNSISRINRDGWSFCQKLHELILSFNNLTRLDEESLADLSSLSILRLSHNSISHIAEGAFRGLKSLRVLDLDHNEISGTIEDTSGAFTGLDGLSKLTLFGNKIKSVAKRAFSGLEGLEHLHISSDSFLCDCQLKWLPPWLLGRMLQGFVTATCAHPESLKGQSIFSVPPDSFVCDDLPKPQIITQPETTMAVVGKDIRFTCSAASSSSSPMTFAWKKDNEVLANADMENFAHVRAQDGEVMEYTTILHLRRVTFGHEGRYQCVITNHFGSTYSHKARLTVNVLPSFTKMPHDIAIRTGTMARLECAATGHPNPQIAWQKDGGTDFPAARERRMHVMPDDDVFFITDVKIDDMGVYSCTAQNSAGSVSANATLTVLETPSLAVPLEDRVVSVGETVALQCKATGSPPPRITWLKGDRPLSLTERHHYTPGNQLLVVQNVVAEDAGRYTCEMSNTLGTERAHSQLSILPTPGCRKDGTTVGIFTIAVVCSVVLTSLVWVCIIYQTRKKSEEYSVTNTDETIVPPDVPSYLSSQGTLSERQETAVRAEGSRQANGHVENDERSGPRLCGDCSPDSDSHSKEPAICPPPAPRDGAQPGTLSSRNDRPQHLSSGTAEGALYPSNHDRMPTACKKKPATPLEGKGDQALSGEEPLAAGSSSRTSESGSHSRARDLQPSSALTPGKPELPEAASGSPDVPSEGQHLLLSNGHLPQACDSSPEATPLTGQPPGKRRTPLLFAPKS